MSWRKGAEGEDVLRTSSSFAASLLVDGAEVVDGETASSRARVEVRVIIGDAVFEGCCCDIRSIGLDCAICDKTPPLISGVELLGLTGC